MSDKKSVVLLGKGDLAIQVASWFHASEKYELTAIVPVIPEPTWTGSLMQWALAAGVPVIESGHYRDLPYLAKEGLKVDLAMSVFYDKIIRQWFIERCSRIINLHNGPLPRYRGVSPINWALKNGESEHGITIHEITPGIDDGPIISQVKYSIFPDRDEVVDVYKRALQFGKTLFEQTLPILDELPARAQDESLATYYSNKENHLLGERSGFTRQQSLAAKH